MSSHSAPSAPNTLMKLRGVATSASVMLAVTLILFLLVELGLRILFPDELQKLHEEQEQVREIAYQHHPDYAIALKPNITKEFTREPVNGGTNITWSTNNLSFRGGQLRSNPELRIVVYGDSNIHARFSATNNTFPTKLQQYLSESNANEIEVINAGIIGFGPDQSVLRLKDEMKIIEPDIIVLHIFADNDFGDLLRNRLFMLGEKGELVHLKRDLSLDPHLMAKAPRLMIQRAARRVSRQIDEWLTGESYTPQGTIEELLTLSTEEWNAYTTTEETQFSHFADHYDIDLALHPDAPSSLEKVVLMEGILALAKAASEEGDAKLLVLIQPSSTDLTTNFLPNYTHFQSYPRYSTTRLTSLVDDICERLEIERVNLFNVFLQNDPEKLFFHGKNNHWNDTGQDLAARTTADYINLRFLNAH